MTNTQTVKDLWNDLSARVRAFVGKRVADAHAADDITQDVMLTIQSKLESVRSEDRLPA